MKIKINSSFLIACFITITALYSCSKSSTTSSGGSGAGGTTTTVSINGMTYSPSSVTVKVGTTVKWTNADAFSVHTATANDGTTFNSGNIASGASYSFTPTVIGNFPYHCLVHGVAMAGTLIVTN